MNDFRKKVVSSLQHLNLQIANSVEDAPDYKKEGEKYSIAILTKAVVVKNGTVEGRSTVDLQFEDENGNKFIAMTTGRLLKMVTTAIGEE